MYDALFKQVGVIRAQTFADLIDIPAALATGRKLRGWFSPADGATIAT